MRSGNEVGIADQIHNTNNKNQTNDKNSLAQASDSSTLAMLVQLGIALSAEHNHGRLLERILLSAMSLTDSDGGTLYLLDDPKFLSFAILRNNSLGTAMGGTTGVPIGFPPLKMYHDDGAPNINNVATYVALKGETINIPDAYTVQHFDFTGTRNFDKNTGYRSKSMLAVPLKNHTGSVIGVIQLINAYSQVRKEVVDFDLSLVPLVEALSSQAAIALNNEKLLAEQKNLLNAVIKMMAHAIDAKSAYTGGHCVRVPIIMDMIAQAACRASEGPFKNFSLTDDQWFEIQVAAGLHDVGKVATPVHILDKATKLELIGDRINEIALRIEILKRDAEIDRLKAIATGESHETATKTYEARVKTLHDYFDLIRNCNHGEETTPTEWLVQLPEIAVESWQLNGKDHPLLSEDEIENLSVQRGTLNNHDRAIINDHIVITIDMLKSLPFPKNLSRVVEIAGAHHERMDGRGYPNGLRAEDMSSVARMLGIADVFEALTAADRPYKKPKTLSQSIKIMTSMAIEGHIDPEIYRLFLESKVFRDYGGQFLTAEQFDEVDIAAQMQRLDSAGVVSIPYSGTEQ